MGRTDGFMSFWRALAQSEIQKALFRIWTWVVDFIFQYDSHKNLYRPAAEQVSTTPEPHNQVGSKPS